MTRVLIAPALFMALALAADADSVRFYFGRPEYISTGAGFVPDHGAPLPDGEAESTVTIGLWVVPGVDWEAGLIDIWDYISLNVLTTGDVTCDDIAMDNSDHSDLPFVHVYRWESTSDFGGSDGGFYLVGGGTYGLGGLLPAELEAGPADKLSYMDGDIGAGVLRYWLGNVTLTGHGAGGDVFLQIGDRGLFRRGGHPFSDSIYLGLDDDPPLLQSQFWAITATPEYRFVVPQPAGLLLLGASGFLLARRRVQSVR